MPAYRLATSVALKTAPSANWKSEMEPLRMGSAPEGLENADLPRNMRRLVLTRAFDAVEAVTAAPFM